jgi:heme A synthase
MHFGTHRHHHILNRTVLIILTIMLLTALGILTYITSVNIPEHIEFLPDFLKAPIVVRD